MIRTEIKVEKIGIRSILQRLERIYQEIKGRGKWVLYCCNCAVVDFSCGWREEQRVKPRVFMRGKGRKEK